MKVFIAAGHGGFEAKKEIIIILEKLNYYFEDLGAFKLDKNDDYPDYAKKLCKQVLKNENSLGILICGSGTGMQIAANKVKGIRAAFCYDEYSAKMSREDNDANILTLRERKFDHKKYQLIVKTFLETTFSNEKRHIKRISKLE